MSEAAAVDQAPSDGVRYRAVSAGVILTGEGMDSSKADEINSLIEMADEELNKVSTGTHQTLYGDGRHDFVSKVVFFSF